RYESSTGFASVLMRRHWNGARRSDLWPAGADATATAAAAGVQTGAADAARTAADVTVRGALRDDLRSDEDQQFGVVGIDAAGAEQAADKGQIAEKGHLLGAEAILFAGQAADDHRIPVAND